MCEFKNWNILSSLPLLQILSPFKSSIVYFWNIVFSLLWCSYTACKNVLLFIFYLIFQTKFYTGFGSWGYFNKLLRDTDSSIIAYIYSIKEIMKRLQVAYLSFFWGKHVAFCPCSSIFDISNLNKKIMHS